MAKKISENAIPDINADWGKDASNGLPYSGQAVQTFIKDTMKSLDSSIKKKVGFLCWSTNIDASNFYHLWGFASEDDCTKYKSAPEANASLLLVNEALPISTIQGDSYAAYLFSDVKVGTDYVVSGTDFNVNLRFSAVRTSSGDRLNFGANGSLTIQRSTDGGSTWSNVDTLEGLLSSHDYSTSSTDYDKVNIGKYLTSGTQKIRMRASFKYTGDDGTEKQVTSTWVAIGNSINRTSLNIELSTNQQPYTPIWVNNLGTAGARKFPLSYVCNGNVAKTLHYAIYDETNTEVLHGVQTGITSNGSIVNLNVGNDTDNPQLFTHGVKTVLVYLTAEDGMGGVIYSNGIVNRFMVVNEADAKTKGIENKRAFLLQQAIPADKMSALSDAEKLTYFDKFTNYTEGKIFDYALFVPTKDEQGNIIVDVDTKVDVTFYLSNYISGNWTPTADGVKMYVEQQENLQASRSQMQHFVPSVEIDSTSTSLYAYLHVWFTDTDGTLKDFLLNSFNVPMYSIAIDNSESYAPVSGTTFLLNPRTRNNTEKEPARIINTVDNSVVESVFDNFDFQTDGWMSKGTAKMLHIPSGRKLTIKTNPLSQFRVNPKSSMVMEMDFDVENVVNEDDPIFELGETVSGVFRGLRIYPMKGELWVKSYGDHHQDIDYGWCEGNKIHLTIAFCANVNPVKYGVKYGTPDVHIPGTTSQYYKDPSTTTIGLVKVFINGNKQREIHFNTEDRDEFCTGVMSNGGIVIGTTGADINLYSLRMYANKEFSDADAQTNYIASRSTTAEKKQLADDNDIYTDEVGKSGKVISIDKVQKHGKNTLLWHGQETYFLQTANVNGWFEIKKYDADGNFLPKHSGSLCRTTGIEILSGNISEWNKSLKASAFPFSKAQGSSAKTYWDWNQQFDMSKFKATIRIPRSAFDSSIVISDTKTLDDGSTVVEIYGGDLGADFPLGNTPKQYPIDMTTGLIEVPDGWIDGNGILIGQRGTIWHSNGDEETVDGTGYYRGPCYQVADGTPFCQKLVNKINNASCQQSHLAGVNNIYNDLHTAIVGQNDLQRLGAANGQNVRVSKYTEPFFYFFKPDDGSDILYRGGCTFGGGKMDKATWGYAKKFNGLKSIKKFCMFEGSDNSLTGTDFRVPFIWKPQGSCPDEMTYSTDDEGFGVSEGTGTDRKWSQCWDFDGGATYSADDELADATHKAGYPTEDIVSAFAAFHNFVYLHNPAIKAYTQGDGTFASFLTSDQAKDYYTKYWMTQGDDRYRLYRYSFGAAAWVDAGLWVQKSDGTYGWDAVYVNSSEPFKYAFSKFGTTYASLPDKLNEMLRKGVVDDFKARLPLYMDPKSLQTYYDLEIHFFCGTDNCGKNTYFVLSQFDRDIQITLPDGTQETHTGVCRFEMHSDDVDTTMAIDNNGRVTHDYDVDRMHPYNKDDTTTTPTYSGMNNVLFNLCEQAWDSDADNTLRTVMAQIFTIMCTLATARDNIPGWPYEKSQQATVLGALWKYIFFIESYFPMSAYNEQGRIRYEYPETLGFVTARQVKPIWMSQGSMDQYELEFMMRRIVYMVSYAAWGPAGKGGNTGIPDADEGGFAMMGTMLPDGTQSVKLEVEVTAHQTIYPTGNVSGAAGATIDPHVRVRAGQKYTLSLGTNTFEKDTYFYVYLRNYYRSFGNLANISLATDFILNGTRLTEFVVNPDNANKYVDKQTGAETLAFRPNGFSIGTAKNIQHLDLHGLMTLKGDINLKDCTRLVDINTEQTKVSTVEFPETMSLETVKLSDTITGVSLPNQGNLQTLTAEGYANIKTLEFGKNTPDDAIVPFVTLCASSATQDMDIELDNVEWDVSFVMSVLLWMIKKTFKGTGRVTVSSQLTPASVQNVSDILGVECFYDDAPFYVKTSGGNFLTGPQNVISGGTADYQMIVIPRSDYTPTYSLQDYESTTKTDGDTIYNKGVAHINGRTGHLTTDESINDVAVKVQGYYSKDGHNDMDVNIGKTTYPQEIRSIQGAEAITKTGEYTYKAQLMPVVYTGKVDVVWDIVSGTTDGMTLVSNGNECTLKVTGSVPVNFNKLVLRATATCGNGSSFTKQKDVFYSQEQPVITTSSNAAVMAVCYKQGWAANANYMLRSECEAVEDLGTAFAGNLLLQHFLELQYFTGLKKIADGAFKGCSQLADFILPQTVTEIGKDAFNDCTALTSVVIPYVVTIDEGAFKGCSSISTFETGDALTTIGTEILSDAQITELSFGPNVATIALDAFDNCQKLTKVTVSSSRFLTWGMAFKNCQSLAEYAVRNDGTTILKAENTILYRTDEQTIVAVPQACTTFTTTGYTLADYAFYWNAKTLGEPVMSSTSNAVVMSVCHKQGWAANDNYMFLSECKAVTDLGTAFAGNTSLQHFTELQYFSGLKKIADGAFKGCTQLKDFTLPKSIIEIGKDAFNGCTALTSIAIPYIVTIDDGAFKGCSSIATFETGDALTTIGSEILSDAQITELSFGPNVATIALDAFDNCQKLTKVTVSSSRFLTWGMAFKNCPSLAEYAVRDDGTTAILKAEKGVLYRADENAVVAVPQNSSTLPSFDYNISDYAFYCNKTAGCTIINPSDYSAELKQKNTDSLKLALTDYVADCKCYVFNSRGTKMAEIKSATFEGTYDTMTKGTVTFMDGTTVDISTLNDAGCNFMVYRPAMHIKSFTDDAGREILQQGGKIPIDGGITFREKFIGMFKGYVQNNVLKSQPGRICDGNRTIATYQALANAGGTGYTQWSYKDWCKENALHLSWFGNTNYEVNIGTGRINNYDKVRNSVTGFTLPMIGTDELYGTRPCVDGAGNAINALNFFHIEGLGELIWEFVIGYRHDESTIYIWDDDTWSESHNADYTVPYSINNANQSYVRQMVAGEHFDMIPRLVNGSSVTGYCDGCWANTSGRLLFVGGSANNGSICGLSASASSNGFGHAGGGLGARLAFSGRPVEVEGSKLLE